MFYLKLPRVQISKYRSYGIYRDYGFKVLIGCWLSVRDERYALYLPIVALKTCCVLEPVQRFDPSTYNCYGCDQSVSHKAG